MSAQVLAWLQALPLSVAITEVWFPFIESLHVLTMAVVAGTLFIIDTRLIGLTSRKLPFSHVSERLLPWTWGAFGCSVVTGTLMFMSNATGYYDNTPFRFKMSLLVLAGVNMLFFQRVTFRKVASWDLGRPPAPARLAGVISLATWCGVIGLGRWIGFAVS